MVWRGWIVVLGLLAAAFASADTPRLVLRSIMPLHERAETYFEEGRIGLAVANAEAFAGLEPFRLRLEAPGLTVRDQQEAERILQRAIDAWHQGLGRSDIFIIDPNGKIPVIVRPQVRENGQIVAAYIHWSRGVRMTRTGYRPEINATIQLAQRGHGRSNLRECQRIHAAAHELGHLLGLDDSRASTGVMTRVGARGQLQPSAEEIAAVRWIRNQALSLLAANDIAVESGNTLARD